MSVVSRAKHFLGRIKKQSKEFGSRRKEYGFKVAMASYIDGIFPPEKHQFYIKRIEKYVDKFMQPIVAKYQNFDGQIQPLKLEKIPVWCCWWQGESQMPEIVKMCNDRLKSLISDDAELHMLTEKNYQDFVQLPDHVLQKFYAGKMSITALTDVLRVALLAEYGGLWIDSTVFISGEFPEEYIHNDYYAQRMYDCGIAQTKTEACKGMWSGFLTGGRPNCINFLLLRDAFYEWWKTHNSVIDYVIYDYFLLSGYKGVPAIKALVDAVPNNNIHIFDMYKKLHLEYTPELYEALTKEDDMHKLTYKIDLYKETPDGKETLYAFLLNKYKNEG